MEVEEITRDEFLRRFKARLRDLLGEAYDFKYVDTIAPTYWDDVDQRSDGPEECAESEAHEWGEE
jgi:hypothetical protein